MTDFGGDWLRVQFDYLLPCSLCRAVINVASDEVEGSGGFGSDAC